MAPQAYAHLIRQLAALHWQHLQVSAEPDPSRTSLRQALAQDQALHQVHTQALLDFCTRLAARYSARQDDRETCAGAQGRCLPQHSHLAEAHPHLAEAHPWPSARSLTRPEDRDVLRQQREAAQMREQAALERERETREERQAARDREALLLRMVEQAQQRYDRLLEAPRRAQSQDLSQG